MRRTLTQRRARADATALQTKGKWTALHAPRQHLLIQPRENVGRAVVALEPDIRLALHGDGEAVAKAVHPAHRSKIMIEGTIFLHQDDDGLDIHAGAGGACHSDSPGGKIGSAMHWQLLASCCALYQRVPLSYCHAANQKNVRISISNCAKNLSGV